MPLSQIIAYNVGFGECLLLKFIDDNKESFLLLDCGSKSHTQVAWKDIAEDIVNQLGNCKELSFMLSHLHDDHYNGFYDVYKCFNGRINLLDFYSAAILNAQSTFDFVDKTFYNFIKEKGSIFPSYRIDKTIKILWPPAPFSQNNLGKYFQTNVPEVDNYLAILKRRCVNNNLLDYKSDFSEKSMNAMSIVFEVDGINDQKYLFTGDLNNLIDLNFSGEFKKNFNIINYSTANIKSKYKMIKMPHHGTENWPIQKELFMAKGYSLVSWGENRPWGAPYLSQYPSVIATNYPDNYANPPWSNIFKIQINISPKDDTVTIF